MSRSETATLPTASETQTESRSESITLPDATLSRSVSVSLPSGTASTSSSITQSETSSVTYSLPSQTVSDSGTPSFSKSNTKTESLRVGVVSVTQDSSVFLNTNLTAALAGSVAINVQGFPEAFQVGASVVITPTGYSKVVFQPGFLQVECCDTVASYSFAMYGVVAGSEMVSWVISPGVNSSVVTPSSSWADIPAQPITVHEQIRITYSGYDFFKGAYPHRYSPSLAVMLSSTPRQNVALTFVVQSFGLDTSTTALKELEKKVGTDIALLESEAMSVYNRSALTFNVKTTSFSWGETEKGLTVMCAFPGVYVVGFEFGGADQPELYAGVEVFEFVCLVPVQLRLINHNTLPPFVLAESKMIEVVLDSTHRDYNSFSVELTCRSVPYDGVVSVAAASSSPAISATLTQTLTQGFKTATKMGSNLTLTELIESAVLSPIEPSTPAPIDSDPAAFIFTPALVSVVSPSGARFSFTPKMSGRYNVSCTSHNTDFYSPASLDGFVVIDKISVVDPVVPPIRVISNTNVGHVGLSGLILLDINTPPRMGLTIRIFGNGLKVVPEQLSYDTTQFQHTFRVFSEWNATDAMLFFEHTGASMADFAPISPVIVNITGPNPLCPDYGQTECTLHWEDMCWWDGGSCRNDEIPFTVPEYSDVFEGDPTAHTVSIPTAVTGGVTLSMSGGGLAFSQPNVSWKGGEGGAKAYVLTSSLLTGETKRFSDLQANFHVRGPDYHHFGATSFVAARILRVKRRLQIITPVAFSGNFPFLYVNATSREIVMRLEETPSQTLTVTPVYDAGSGVVFTPKSLVFYPGETEHVYKISASGVLGGVNISWTVSGLDTANYITPGWKVAKVFPTNAIAVPPLPTASDGIWSAPQRVHVTRAPFSALHLVISSKSTSVHFRECTKDGRPLGGTSIGVSEVEVVHQSVNLVLNALVLTVYFQVRGIALGAHVVVYNLTGPERLNFVTPPQQVLVVHEKPVWGGGLPQMGVDPHCRYVEMGSGAY